MNLFKNSANKQMPAENAFAITPSDTVDFVYDDGAVVPRSLYIGTPGNLSVVTLGGETITFANVSGILPIMVRRVLLATTASDIVGIY